MISIINEISSKFVTDIAQREIGSAMKDPDERNKSARIIRARSVDYAYQNHKQIQKLKRDLKGFRKTSSKARKMIRR